MMIVIVSRMIAVMMMMILILILSIFFLCLYKYLYVFMISMYAHVYREQTKDVGAKTPEMLEKIIAGI